MNAGQLSLDLLAAPSELPPTNGAEPTPVARDPLDLSDIDIDHAERFLEAELADALADQLASGCPPPRRCCCERPIGDHDQDGAVYCVRCGCRPRDRNGGPP